MEAGNLLLFRLLLRDLRENWPTFKKRFLFSLARWRNEFLLELSKFLVLTICVWGGYLVALFYLAALWAVFADTPMGNIFATRVSPEIVTAITSVISLDLQDVATACVLNSLLMNLLAGLFLKFSGLFRMAVQNRGLLGVMFWAAIATAGVAHTLPIVGMPDSLPGNAVIYFLPTISLLSGCYNLAARLVPEFTVVLQLVGFLRERLQVIKIRDLPSEPSGY